MSDHVMPMAVPPVVPRDWPRERVKNAATRRKRIVADGLRLDLMLPRESREDLLKVAKPGEKPTQTIIRALKKMAGRR